MGFAINIHIYILDLWCNLNYYGSIQHRNRCNFHLKEDKELNQHFRWTMVANYSYLLNQILAHCLFFHHLANIFHFHSSSVSIAASWLPARTLKKPYKISMVNHTFYKHSLFLLYINLETEKKIMLKKQKLTWILAAKRRKEK
ncbi:hypothetical protein BpHYR1_019642 [Brachionus plicatilis]|uniref:Uncharacterized protein n=1 Tax=Brachionus plicatilis TaxID=10195 RepID=A0A3M7RB69_BRAPC|nr:hypothetical protein BpHYR1_019642 [Brachionus plicatilis]